MSQTPTELDVISPGKKSGGGSKGRKGERGKKTDSKGGNGAQN